MSLVRDDGSEPEQLSEHDVWYGLDHFPNHAKEVKQFRKGKSPDDGYMTFVTVRHPLSRLYSAWKDKFRSGHPWMKPIRKMFGAFLNDLETKDMTDELYEYSFEAFLELVAITDYDFQRDRHWQSVMFYCGPCNYEYDFIIHNEDAAESNRFILWTMNNAHTKTHVPSAYRTHSTEEMLKPYRNISSVVLKQIYRNYYSDFVYFNYTLDDVFKVTRNVDSPEIVDKRKKNRRKLKEKYLYLERVHNEDTCEPIIADYNPIYGDY